MNADASELCRLAGGPVEQDMTFPACNQRDRLVGRIWRPINKANSSIVPCYDCASEFTYQYRPCTADGIQRGVWAWDDGWDCYGLCDKHYRERKARGEQ